MNLYPAMGNDQKEIAGLSLVCSQSGTIIEVLHDGLKATTGIGKDALLTSMVPSSEFNKVMNFLTDIETKGSSDNWQINTRIEDEIVTLNFVGGSIGERFLIVSTPSMTDLPSFFELVIERLPGHLKLPPEQINKLSQSFRTGMNHGIDLMDELSRLNNELVNMQRELQKNNVELHKLNELKNRFLGIAVHDLRNPLSLVSGYNEILMEELRDTLSEDHQKIFDTVHNSLEYMFFLIEDLLDYSVFESGNLKIDPVAQDLLKTIEEVVSLNRVLAERKKITIEFNPVQGSMVLQYDQRRISQVFNNLLSNAIKFSHHHSSIWIETGTNAEFCIISVKDEGTGIKEEVQDKLFLPHQKEGSSGTDGELSTGLGLWIVHNIITAHGGRVWIEQNIPKGTIFSISLPMQPKDI